YDALGRVTQTTRQDGSIATVLYSGNCSTATDEAGKQRKACSDALGRLVEVDEVNPGAASTSGTGTVTLAGSEQSTTMAGTNGTSGTGSVTIGGAEQSHSQR